MDADSKNGRHRASGIRRPLTSFGAYGVRHEPDRRTTSSSRQKQRADSEWRTADGGWREQEMCIEHSKRGMARIVCHVSPRCDRSFNAVLALHTVAPLGTCMHACIHSCMGERLACEPRPGGDRAEPSPPGPPPGPPTGAPTGTGARRGETTRRQAFNLEPTFQIQGPSSLPLTPQPVSQSASPLLT